MSEELKPASERLSTWGLITCANVWIAASHSPAGLIVGLLFLAFAGLLLWAEWYDNRCRAPGA